METNPYAAPGAVVEDVSAFGGNDLEARKATRGQRLGAVLLDSLFACVCLVPIFFSGVMHGLRTSAVTDSASVQPGLIALGGLLLLGVLVYDLILLSRNGQTIGKRILNIKIVRTDGSPVTLLRVIFLRWVPIGLLQQIPLIGPLIGLADSLVIFGSDKRCIHDYIADTIVIVD